MEQGSSSPNVERQRDAGQALVDQKYASTSSGVQSHGYVAVNRANRRARLSRSSIVLFAGSRLRSAGMMVTVDTTSPDQRALVEAGWQKVRDDGRVRPDLLEAAYAEPRLRQLFPWTGMGELHFSRCTEWQWAWDVPYIQPASEGEYWVAGPLRSESVSPARTALEAVAMVVDRLPPHCRPALVGTPEELAAHDAAILRANRANRETPGPDRSTS
ncbi:DUF6193 family natural product biosynthesis protein [Kitasatospora nipponensis]|uniref:DUF6193 family natural product biosynthesis protein n=1 Tax=Kitasatospora nipponensis TaxID=258049 RepID=UPI0031D5EDF7